MDLIDFSVVRFGKLRRLWDNWEIGEIGQNLEIGEIWNIYDIWEIYKIQEIWVIQEIKKFQRFHVHILVPYCRPILLSHVVVPFYGP